MPSIEELNFAFLDVETTGLAAFYDDRVCEIGMVMCGGLEVVSTWQALVNPERPISGGAMAVHGITNEMVESAPRFSEVAGKVLENMEGAVVVCHNAPFDLSFMHSEFKKCGIAFPDFPVMDTLKIARRYFNFPSNSLTNIAYGLHIDMENAHRALADASATQKVFRYMISELMKRGLPDIGKLFSRAPHNFERMSTMKPVELPPVIEKALKEKCKIFVRYLSSSGAETERVLTPKEIKFLQDYAYLVAYCDLRREERTFRLDRIIEAKII